MLERTLYLENQDHQEVDSHQEQEDSQMEEDNLLLVGIQVVVVVDIHQEQEDNPKGEKESEIIEKCLLKTTSCYFSWF